MSLRAAMKTILTLSCDKSAILLSDTFDRPLTRVERIALRLHLFICRNCRRFRHQIAFIHTAVHRATGGQVMDESITRAATPDDELSPEARQRIADAMRPK
jgi:hypothetical protein